MEHSCGVHAIADWTCCSSLRRDPHVRADEGVSPSVQRPQIPIVVCG
jgi:hypothetical protein